MKSVIKLFFSLHFLALSPATFSQDSFTNCSAAFLDKKMVVNEYTPNGQCILSADAAGVLTVCTAELSPESSIPVDKLSFKIAIRDGNTKTLFSFSDSTYEQIDIGKVLSMCRKGDHIVLLTTDDRFALPHNEILVN
jgi:hypothetical protein